MKPRYYSLEKTLKHHAMQIGMYIMKIYLEKREDRDVLFTIQVREVNGKVNFDIMPDIISGNYQICQSCGCLVHESIFDKHQGECQLKLIHRG